MYVRIIKRLLDLIISLIAFIILIPLFIIIALAIKTNSKGPVFFRQKRVACNKEYFNIYKFRTMYQETPQDVPTHLFSEAISFITPVGSFLRKTSLDELPQLINIIKGEMSFIGPRPALWNQYDLIEERDEYGANNVRPGLSGWAQINGRDELDIQTKARLDGYYASHISFLFDLRCFFGTFLSVFREEGVVEGGTGSLSKRKKVMIITNHSYMLYRFRKELITSLKQQYDIVLVMPYVGHEDDFQAMGICCIETKFERRGTNPFKEMKLFKRYKQILKEEHPDYVITYSIKPNIYAGILCKKMHIPYAVNVQGLGTAFEKRYLSKVVTKLYRYALKRVETVFFENKQNAKEFLDRKIINKDQVKVLNGAGINIDEYAYQAYPTHETFHFLYLGRIMKEKGMDELFAAAQRLREENNSFIIDIVGFFEDEYEKQINEMKDFVHFHGFQENPIPYYAEADCIVMPSYHEGLSNVLLEASAIGRPVITTNIPGCREAVDDKTTGLLVKVRDSNSLYQAMKQMLETSAAKRKEMGLAARQKIINEFEKSKVVNETIQQIQKGGSL